MQTLSKFKKPEFWVTNTSPMNVTLADLALNIKAYTTVNLLDKKHYSYTLDQLLISSMSGSLFKKRDKIVVRRGAPPKTVDAPPPIQREAVMPSRERSILAIKEIEYDELKVSDDKERQKEMDEQYAKDNADLAEADTHKLVTSKKG